VRARKDLNFLLWRVGIDFTLREHRKVEVLRKVGINLRLREHRKVEAVLGQYSWIKTQVRAVARTDSTAGYLDEKSTTSNLRILNYQQLLNNQYLFKGIITLLNSSK
jgi:hypothetical protein